MLYELGIASALRWFAKARKRSTRNGARGGG